MSLCGQGARGKPKFHIPMSRGSFSKNFDKRGARYNIVKWVCSYFSGWKCYNLVYLGYNIANIQRALNSHIAKRKFIIAIHCKILEARQMHFE